MKFSVSALGASRALQSFAGQDSSSPSFLHDVLHGLAQPQKSVPPKYFYDARGSELFESICATPEYYPTRVEMGIMAAHIADMAALIPAGHALIELGSGASLKTRLLIEHGRPSVYIPIDVSPSALQQACNELGWRFPALQIEAQIGDFTALRLPAIEAACSLVYFPGSTIGNFHPEEAADFLCALRAQLDAGDLLLIGIDLKKDERTLNNAYNDTQGVTAAFNLNLLERINRELGADFDLHAFRHLAFYNVERGWIEMHLRSLRAQTVQVAGHRFEFRADETLLTEISCKYDIEEFRSMAVNVGFNDKAVWTDADNFFGIFMMQAG